MNEAEPIRDGAEPAESRANSVEIFFASILEGETRALARAVSLVEDGADGALELLALCRGFLSGNKRAVRIGITGPAGAGKSTLVNALTRELRGQGRRVGIVAIDPSSPFSGGAILGDRIRVDDVSADAGVFMRSMATRGHLGGLARATDGVLTVIETAWAGNASKDVLLIETTGVGQGEIEIVGLADVVAVVLVPGMGDSVQSLKAGVLEIASIFVLNKADREGVDRLEAEIGEMLGLAEAIRPKEAGAARMQRPIVVKTIATSGEGVATLLSALDACELGSAARDGLPIRAGIHGRTALFAPPSNAVLDHIGIAVRSLQAAQGLYAMLGAAIQEVEEIMHERVRVVMIATGESRIELLEPTTEDSAVGRFLSKRGEGIHHIALRVADLAAVAERLKSDGVRLVADAIQLGAGGHRYVFVHPSSANGVLLELVEAAPFEGGRH